VSRLAAALAGALLLTGADSSGSAVGPREAMQSTIDAVLAVLNDPALDAAGRRAAIEEIAYESFDMTTMSRLVLARHYKRFTPQQRDAYVTEFKTYLANNYGGRIERYEQEQVEITGIREEPRGDVTVHTRIVGGEFENAIVDYRLRKRDGRWRIIDVVIEGISMVSNFRDQFKEVLSRGGPDHLLAKLREKNALGPVEN
jgi:phospholipid transport system substrate-binding protein